MTIKCNSDKDNLGTSGCLKDLLKYIIQVIDRASSEMPRTGRLIILRLKSYYGIEIFKTSDSMQTVHSLSCQGKCFD